MGGTRVGPHARREYVARMRERYEMATRAAKSRLLDEVCEVTGYHRKAVIRLLRRPVWNRRPGRGRPVRYGPVVVGTLRRIWEAAGYPWSVRLQALLPTWVPWACRRWRIPRDVAARLRTMSPRHMDRCLRPFKCELRKRQYGRTKPGNPFALAQQIDQGLARIYRLANQRVSPATVTKPRVDAARPVDAQNAPTRSLENRTGRGFPQRPHASSSSQPSVTGLLARRCPAR